MRLTGTVTGGTALEVIELIGVQADKFFGDTPYTITDCDVQSVTVDTHTGVQSLYQAEFIVEGIG